MAPVAGPEIEHAAGNERKRDRIGANHPLAMLDDLAVTRGYEGGGSAGDPGGGLHRCSGKAGAAGGEGDPGQGTDKDADNVDASEDAMEFQVTLAEARRELHRAGQERNNAGECMGDQEMAVGDYLQTVGVVHGVIGDEKNFRSDEDKERSNTKGDPENGFESGTAATERGQGGRCHYSPVRWVDVMWVLCGSTGHRLFGWVRGRHDPGCHVSLRSSRLTEPLLNFGLLIGPLSNPPLENPRS